MHCLFLPNNPINFTLRTALVLSQKLIELEMKSFDFCLLGFICSVVVPMINGENDNDCFSYFTCCNFGLIQSKLCSQLGAKVRIYLSCTYPKQPKVILHNAEKSALFFLESRFNCENFTIELQRHKILL